LGRVRSSRPNTGVLFLLPGHESRPVIIGQADSRFSQPLN
jgi:hypothetical protein